MQIESHTPFGNNYVEVIWFIVSKAQSVSIFGFTIF
jgi:hypothetical protein